MEGIMRGDKLKVWITKYALTKGIYDVEVEESSDPTMVIDRENLMYYHGEGRDWHRTEAAAKAHAILMVRARIASLKKSLVKLERMVF